MNIPDPQALHIFQQLMSIKKDGSFSKLIQDLTDHRLTFSAVICPHRPHLGQDPGERPPRLRVHVHQRIHVRKRPQGSLPSVCSCSPGDAKLRSKQEEGQPQARSHSTCRIDHLVRTIPQPPLGKLVTKSNKNQQNQQKRRLF